MKLMIRVLMVTGFWVIAATSVYAEGESAKAGMDPALMEKMQTLMAPNEAHKVLESFVGKWATSGTFRTIADGPADEMTGTAENEIIFGGRFLLQKFEGPWMGQNFSGIGYTGFDNIKQEYVSIWLDSMGTGIMTMTGKFDAATKSLNQSGANSCPLTGEPDRKGRSEWTAVDADHSTYTSYMTGADGKEFKAMELRYTRIA